MTDDTKTTSDGPKISVVATDAVAVPPPPDTYSFKDVDDSLTAAFSTVERNNSTVCDIIAMYLKGQKILYTESKTYCEQYLNLLMLPSIFITVVCSVLNLAIKDVSYAPILVSSLNGFTAFILALINYLKLDAKAEAHRTAAYKFDKLQSELEFTSGKILFVPGASSELARVISDTEGNVREIKETNQFILPERIRYTYPTLYSFNVFSEVKKIQNKEMRHVNELKDVYNELERLKCVVNGDDAHRKRIQELEAKRQACIDNILQIRDDYLRIDDEFENEMVKNRMRQSRRFECCGFLKA